MAPDVPKALRHAVNDIGRRTRARCKNNTSSDVTQETAECDRTRLACMALFALGTALPALAHHSTANFDMARSITIAGKVTYFAFTNPHSYFDMDVTD